MSRKLTRAPARQRLLVAKDTSSKVVVTPRLALAQCRDTKDTAGARMPGLGGRTR